MLHDQNTIHDGVAVGQVQLKPRRARPFYARHPWVFDTAVAKVQGRPQDGDVVNVVCDRGRFIARGIFNSRSRLIVRLYSWQPDAPLDDDFWSARIERAIELRRQMQLIQPRRAARLVFSEADGLSGLVVDRYDQYLVVQLNSLAMSLRCDRIIERLSNLLEPRGVLVRTEKGIAREEGLQPRQGLAWGAAPEGPVFISEHGMNYGVDLLAGQKTGFYLDHAENRLAAARYLADRSVLDMFCYTGAFSLSAAAVGRAQQVLGIDSSERAIAWASANVQLNGVANVRFQQHDAFQALDELQIEGARFGAVILDPPKFTRTRRSVDKAIRAYHRINRLAVDLLEPGGILVTCSCSGNVSRKDFRGMLAGVAEKAGRDIQVLEQRGAAGDHPLSVTCPESEYLKCFICRVP
jgi:23S rRNA (cytosine1962-C5)-methyltransferase